jgi:hypothetical protein
LRQEEAPEGRANFNLDELKLDTHHADELFGNKVSWHHTEQRDLEAMFMSLF